MAGASTQADLTGLEENVLYNITISASTSAGEGPGSITIAARTAEAGKLFKNNVVNHLFAYILCNFRARINLRVSGTSNPVYN